MSRRYQVRIRERATNGPGITLTRHNKPEAACARAACIARALTEQGRDAAVLFVIDTTIIPPASWVIWAGGYNKKETRK